MVLDTTREREREKYLVTDAELIRRLGVPEKDARRVLFLWKIFAFAHDTNTQPIGKVAFRQSVPGFLGENKRLERSEGTT
jgi:hypothetical protein